MEEAKMTTAENQEEQQCRVTADINDIVSIEDGMMFTTSLMVAQCFDKNHFDVLKAIKNLECSETFRASNFAVADYTDEQGKPRPAFHLTRDGFSFLAMGFTGSKAAAWKEKFLEAFNAMEEALRARALPTHNASIREPAPTKAVQPRKKCTKRQLAVLNDFITLWCHIEGCTADEATQLLQTALRVPALNELQQTAFNKAAGLAWHFTFQKSDFTGGTASPESQGVLKSIMRLWEFYGNGCAVKDIEEHICRVCKASSLESLSEADTRKAIFIAFMGFAVELPPE